ncbi:dihydroxy-acid dehydratase [Rhizobiaceae bacterium BDR2-2]|uniref:Dihydroxy-acid dehydratase n=1 Tax=Ectorhizobium quercum TaxID=2965071 RepID=A0AAE3SW17_9HYPH|nr:dihydroxy-acid dehydratase [Ectorhizobium quercum]MCX8996985.1 dihydroxy-acid dehydratase [Ectorhizobium quercum]
MPEGKGLRRNVAHYGDAEFAAYLRKAFIKAMGYTDEALERPVIGIVDTGSGFNACHRNMPDLIEAASRGVMLAGAIPVPFPVISLQESFAHPSTMYLRNLMAMDAEEMIRAQPMDAVILIGGCDKTVPALLMGAASADIPAIMLVTGPMMAGSWRGERLGACTDCRRFWGRFRAGELDAGQIAEVSDNLAPTIGTCGVMGTASTMALAVEAMGMMLPGGACAPAVSSERRRIAELTGTRAVEIAREGLKPSDIMTVPAFENAFRTVMAAGGSTNAIIHLTAMAGRLGIKVSLETVDRISRETPVLVDLKPSGRGYMEDLHRAGGLTPILHALRGLMKTDALTITGRTLGDNIDAAPPAWPQDVVRGTDDPVVAGESMVVLGGNLAPGGALLKTAAASPALLKHRGRAVVFDSLADMAERIDSPDLDVNPDDILVLKNAGPIGAPGMPEAGYIPIPKKLAQQGVKDMVRISDARMSGTAFGTIVLHITPEAAAGGPLQAVRSGDIIALDAAARSLLLEVAPEEIAFRLAQTQPCEKALYGYARLYRQSIRQADEGCDFDFCIPPVRDCL